MNQAQVKKITDPWYHRGVEVDVRKDSVTVYHNPEEKGHARALDALKDIEAKLGAAITKKQTSGVHTILFYKDTPADRGDYMDKGSRWHYESQAGEANALVEQVLEGKDPRKVVTRALEEGSYWGSSLGRFKAAHMVTGDQIRYRWDSNSLYLEELPGKPIKRKVRQLRVYTGSFTQGSGRPWRDHFIMENILHTAQLHTSMTYDAAKSALEKALKKATEDADKDGTMNQADFQRWGGMDALRSESQVSYLEVEPHDYQPIQAKGKDFTIECKWDDFRAYSPSSNLQDIEPYYQYYAPTSAQSARMLFQALKADPTILRNVTWMKFRDWAKESGLSVDTHSSVWH